MSPEPFVSRAKDVPARRSEKGYGDENVLSHYFQKPGTNIVPRVRWFLFLAADQMDRGLEDEIATCL